MNISAEAVPFSQQPGNSIELLHRSIGPCSQPQQIPVSRTGSLYHLNATTKSIPSNQLYIPPLTLILYPEFIPGDASAPPAGAKNFSRRPDNIYYLPFQQSIFSPRALIYPNLFESKNRLCYNALNN